MEIKNHQLKGNNVKFIQSPTHGSEFKAGDLDTLLMHYTAGPNADAMLRVMANPRIKASAHLIIDRDGSVYQLVPFNLIAWHAGKSEYNGRIGYNNYSIGIEMVNAGFLSKQGSVYRSAYGVSIDPSEVIVATHRNQTAPKYWQTYTQEQIEVVEDIAQLIIDTYGLKYILGHEEVSPRLRTDPGPAFPLDKLRDRLTKGHKDIDIDDLPDEGRVMVRLLNIRSQPSTSGAKVTDPLKQGTKVKIIDERNGWYKVNVMEEYEGWVASKYLKED